MIAGGKPAEAVLVSRNVLQVTIAKDATPTPSESGCPLLDINVATPNGVSNHLLIKMEPSNPDRKPADEKTNAPHEWTISRTCRTLRSRPKKRRRSNHGDASADGQAKSPRGKDPAVHTTGTKGR